MFTPAIPADYRLADATGATVSTHDTLADAALAYASASRRAHRVIAANGRDVTNLALSSTAARPAIYEHTAARIVRVRQLQAEDPDRGQARAARYAAVLRKLRARELEPALRRLRDDILRARAGAAYLYPANDRAVWAQLDAAASRISAALMLLHADPAADDAMAA